MSEKIVRYLTARVGDQWYGIEVAQIIEVINMIAFTEVTGSAQDLLGLITVRDQVIPLIDMRRRLGFLDAPLRLNTPVIAVRSGDVSFALAFDEADRVEEIPLAMMSPFSDIEQLPFVGSVARLGDRLVLLLNLAELARSRSVMTTA